MLATHLREKHGARLPEGIAVQDWGVTYDEIGALLLARRTDDGRRAGRREIYAAGRSMAAIFSKGRARTNILIRRINRSYATLCLRKAALDLGYHPYPVPAATLSRNYPNPDGVERSGCAYCGYCMRYGCMIRAKAQPTNTFDACAGEEEEFYAAHGMPGAPRDPSRWQGTGI